MIPEWMFASAFLAGLLTGLGLLWRRSALVEHLEDELRLLTSATDGPDVEFFRRLESARELLKRIEEHRRP